VRVPGIDTETGRRQPRQLGTFRSRRAAQSAATSFAASGDTASDRGTVAHLLERWVAGKIDVSNKTRQQYQWAAGHIKTGLGGIRADHLERDDIARWLEALAAEGRLSRRSIQIIRMVLRAALDDAVAIGELRRNPAARVAMPREWPNPLADERLRCGLNPRFSVSSRQSGDTAGKGPFGWQCFTVFDEASFSACDGLR